MPVYVGTSGWQYSHWRGVFYPQTLPQKDWFAFYAERFQTVEVNNTFYRLPNAEVFQHWAEGCPPDFRFALKFSRYLTHIKRLLDPSGPVDRFLKAAKPLGAKAGPLLLQLPPSFEIDLDRLDATLGAFPRHAKVAVEFRDDSWYKEEVREVLVRHRASLCLADRGEELVTPAWSTTNWGYVRFHLGKGKPDSGYRPLALQGWAKRIAGLWKPDQAVFVYFNNDPNACAIRDAARLAGYLKELGIEVSRTPSSPESASF
jgi:uncharacterized protein YecE (DUF72 family)